MHSVTKDFPALQANQDLVYLDSAASTQLCQASIDAMNHYMSHQHSNVNRSSHQLARQATGIYQQAREHIAGFLQANSKELIFSSGTTAALNLVANGLADTIKPGDEIWVSEMEHHANLVPWQQLAKAKQAKLVAIPVQDNGDLSLDLFHQISAKVKVVALCHVSNTLGTVNPIPRIAQLLSSSQAKLIVDGAQAVAHLDVVPERLGCDFYVFSGHKVYGPTGIGVLWGKQAELEALIPSTYGGEMIASVSFTQSTWNDLPYRLEPGTPNIIGAVGLAAALDYLASDAALEAKRVEKQLFHYALQKLNQHPQVEVLSQAMMRTALIPFRIKDVHPHDAAMLLDQQNIALRCGHHCAMPLSEKLFPQGSLRASLAIYTQPADIDALIHAIDKVVELHALD